MGFGIFLAGEEVNAVLLWEIKGLVAKTGATIIDVNKAAKREK